eukprot:CAMPEP_0167818566 /NCGR_PEP_ID=MMETSP0112_2-20121227/4876_1 /TAXON_ID=91324 /ORGANISM="Lotharella globosa, Strain CCCM811" /LENGTH=242 /DNA_ID=CAMNT_0007718565 /DNA_START=1036 /DNA_END=1764 /DNA_ORIENTATION=+
MMFIKIWLGAAVVGLIPYAFAIPGLIPLYAYRILSLAVITIETVLYTLVLSKIWNAKNATGGIIYYCTTIFCRIGILVGIGLRLDGASVLVVNAVHYTAVITTALSLMMFTKLFHKALNAAKTKLTSAIDKKSSAGTGVKNSHVSQLQTGQISVIKKTRQRNSTMVGLKNIESAAHLSSNADSAIIGKKWMVNDVRSSVTSTVAARSPTAPDTHATSLSAVATPMHHHDSELSSRNCAADAV